MAIPEMLYGRHESQVHCKCCGSDMGSARPTGGGGSRIGMTCIRDGCGTVLYIYTHPVQVEAWPHLCPPGQSFGSYVAQLMVAASVPIHGAAANQSA